MAGKPVSPEEYEAILDAIRAEGEDFSTYAIGRVFERSADTVLRIARANGMRGGQPYRRKAESTECVPRPAPPKHWLPLAWEQPDKYSAAMRHADAMMARAMGNMRYGS